jgi:hypothetical protein
MTLYATLALALTYPYVRDLRVMEPGDAAFFSWEVAWTLHALTTDPARLPHANIYHPERYAFGMDEPILGSSILLLPLWAFTHDAVLLLNLLRLLIFTLCGFHAYLLAKELGCDDGPALLAGAAFSFSPLRMDQVGHLSTLGAQWLPLVLLYLHRYARTGRLRHAAAAGAFFGLAGWACGYHGIIGLAVLPFAVVPLFWGRWSRLWGLTLAAALAGAALLPLERLHALAFGPHGFERGRDDALLYSASLEAFLASHSWNRLYGSLTESFRDTGGGTLFPGVVIPGIIVAGVVGLCRRRTAPSRVAIGLGALAVASALIALGPEIRVANQTLFAGPFEGLRETIPAFRFIRVTTRASVFIALALPLLAARALQPVAQRHAWVAGLAILALAEGAIAPIPSAAWARVVDTSQPPPPVYRWLAAQPGDAAIVELPMLRNDGRFSRPAFHESVYMVYSTLHWRPLVNGYAGIEPKRYRVVRDLLRRFPSEASLRSLRAVGVRYVILHWEGYGPNKTRRLRRELPRVEEWLAPVAQFGNDSVYELLDVEVTGE